jgi:hypothetical protein
MRLVKVKDHRGLYRDMDTQAIINMDDEEYNSYQERKKRVLAEKARIDNHGIEINNMKQELSEIKQLLYRILESQDANNKK